MRLVSLIGFLGLLFISLACGGGGGGSDSGGSSFDGAFYSVDFTSPGENNFSLTSEYGSSVSIDLDGGFLSESRDLLVGVRADDGELIPRMKMALKHVAVSGGNLTENYNAVMYGLPDTGGAVAVAQYFIDFSSPTSPSANTVMVAPHAGGLSAMLPGSGNSFQLDGQGAIQWGDWTGGASAGGNTLLMSKGNVFLLASKERVSDLDLSSTVFQNCASVFQVDGDPGTALSTITYSASQFSLEIDDTKVTTPGNVPNLNLTRGFFQTGTFSSLIVLTHTTVGDQREQGFVGTEEFFVVINPDNSVRPTVSIGFLEE